VAVKNTDTREHDILDADDYFQEHGGMVATIAAITGAAPRAVIGDSSDPARPKARSLAEETDRIFRARVINPRWIASMQRHGYKGAFEMSATVDYLFGYDATTGVVADWQYARLTEAYVLDDEVREFFQASNPWALHAIAERLLEAVDRGMWAEPEPELLERLRKAYLDSEGDVEDHAEVRG
jgi:cobaltochelatase CobN